MRWLRPFWKRALTVRARTDDSHSNLDQRRETFAPTGELNRSPSPFASLSWRKTVHIPMNDSPLTSQFPSRFIIHDRTLRFTAGSRAGERIPLTALEDAGFLAGGGGVWALARVFITPDRFMLIADVWEGVIAPEGAFKRAWDAHFRRNFLALGMESAVAERFAALRDTVFARQSAQLLESVSWNAGTRIQSGYLEPTADGMTWIAPRGVRPSLPSLTTISLTSPDVRLATDRLAADLRSEATAINDAASPEILRRIGASEETSLARQATAGALETARSLLTDW
jgi:hypothetical protein